MLLGVVLSTVLIMVTLVSIVSTLAKSVKEAAAMVGPLSLVSILFGFATMLLDANAWWCYLIPILNSATALSAIFSAAANPTFVLITVGVNVLFAVGLAALLAKLFNSEKVMFNK
jgi:sodium transport system permease protein